MLCCQMLYINLHVCATQRKGNSKRTAVKDHILTCEKCKSESLAVNNIKVEQKCNNEYETKIQEALFIKKTES